MNTCKYLKLKLDRTLFCKKNNKLINFRDCQNCKYKDLKQIKTQNTLNKTTPKLTKKQKERFSIIYRSLLICAECGSKTLVQKNEVFEGAKRGTSMAHGFVVPLCDICHKRFHKERGFALKYKKMFQKKYEETHTHQEFLNLIHKNYL